MLPQCHLFHYNWSNPIRSFSFFFNFEWPRIYRQCVFWPINIRLASFAYHYSAEVLKYVQVISWTHTYHSMPIECRLAWQNQIFHYMRTKFVTTPLINHYFAAWRVSYAANLIDTIYSYWNQSHSKLYCAQIRLSILIWRRHIAVQHMPPKKNTHLAIDLMCATNEKREHCLLLISSIALRII